MFLESHEEMAYFLSVGVDVTDELCDWFVDLNSFNDYWHSRNNHANGAISNCRMCVAEGNSKGLSGYDIQRRAELMEMGRRYVMDSVLNSETFEDVILYHFDFFEVVNGDPSYFGTRSMAAAGYTSWEIAQYRRDQQTRTRKEYIVSQFGMSAK